MSFISLVDSFSNRMGGGKVSSNGSNSSSENHKLQEEPVDVKTDQSREDVNNVVNELNKMSAVFNDNKIRFTIHEKTNMIVIKVINSETDEIVREIPAKHSIKLLEHFKENMGMFIDKSI